MVRLTGNQTNQPLFMKKLWLPLLLLLMYTSLSAQSTYKGLPVIKAQKELADYRVNDSWSKGQWRINADYSPDVLAVPCFSKNVSFAFYTDVDSIAFTINSQKVQQFYVLGADGRYALTEVRGFDYDPIEFDAATQKEAYTFWYEKGEANPYLASLKNKYGLQQLVEGLASDSARALRILNWVHHQWKHNGSNEPSKKDALTILAEVKEGKNFRCVEYGIVTTAALNAIGLPARVLGLKTKEVETTESGAGHVLLEVYLKDLRKWVVLDGQWNTMPVLNGVPLNAVEFQQAISKNYDALQIRSLTGEDKAAYIKWIFPYLYYFDVAFDNRESIDHQKQAVGGKTMLMLVPKGAKAPTVFQKKFPINYAHYTHSIEDFYRAPTL